MVLAPNVAQGDASTTLPSIFINKTGATANIMTLQKGGTPVFSVLNSGALSLTLTDASALNVTNGTTQFFDVDTTGTGVIKIGGTAIDGTATFLVLDSYNGGATDPAGGQNGAMYYNTTTLSNRCFENAIWKNCSAGVANSVTTDPAAMTNASAAKAAAATILISPMYAPGQITVNSIKVRVTTTLGAVGQVGIYNASGTKVLTGTLAITAGVQTITPIETGVARILEPGQYYIALTWNSAVGVVTGTNLGAAGAINRTGSIAAGGGATLPATVTLSAITNGQYMYGFSINN
jgi:hypothetical protein